MLSRCGSGGGARAKASQASNAGGLGNPTPGGSSCICRVPGAGCVHEPRLGDAESADPRTQTAAVERRKARVPYGTLTRFMERVDPT